MQRAEILGNRTFAMRIWLKPDKMAALRHFAVAGAGCAGAQQLPLGPRRTKGSMVSVNLVANTDLRTAEEFRQLVVKEERRASSCGWARSPTWCSGAENYEEDVRFNGETATFMGIWVLPTANSLEVIERVREAMPSIKAQIPTGMKVDDRLRLDGVHPGLASTRSSGP